MRLLEERLWVMGVLVGLATAGAIPGVARAQSVDQETEGPAWPAPPPPARPRPPPPRATPTCTEIAIAEALRDLFPPAPGPVRASSVALLVAYLLVLQVMLTMIERRGDASGVLVACVVVADMVLLFGVMLLTTPPSDYQRGLIVSIFTVQFTMLYFGQRATVYNLVCVALLDCFNFRLLPAANRGRIENRLDQC